MPITSDRCTIVRLPIRDLDRAAEDPKLAALIAEGWSIVGDLPIQGKPGEETWALLLAPPAEIRKHPADAAKVGFLLSFMVGASVASAFILLASTFFG